MGLREQFYETLRADFEDGQRTSFLYRYLERERQDHPREDDYARLERCYARMESGGADQRDYLALALGVLIKNSRLRPGKARELLLDYGRALGGPELFQGRRRDREKYEALLAALEAGEPSRPMTPKAVRALHEELRSAILCRDAQTYLYDAGRKRDRDMAMLEAYCDERGLTLTSGGSRSAAGGALTREELEQWETLFQAIRRERRTRVLIPIRLDPWTGAGLYIVGSAYYPGPKRKEACYYACFYLDDLAAQETEDLDMIFRAYQDEWEQMRDLPGLEEAEKWYRFHTLREDAGRFYRRNKSAPEGCPQPLRKYFQDDSRPGGDRSDLESKGRAVFELETADEPMKRGVWKK